jgi:hypothetical protein
MPKTLFPAITPPVHVLACRANTTISLTSDTRTCSVTHQSVPANLILTIRQGKGEKRRYYSTWQQLVRLGPRTLAEFIPDAGAVTAAIAAMEHLRLQYRQFDL